MPFENIKTEIIRDIRVFESSPSQSNLQNFPKTDVQAFVKDALQAIECKTYIIFYLYFLASDLVSFVHSFENDKVYKCVQNIRIYFFQFSNFSEILLHIFGTFVVYIFYEGELESYFQLV